MLVKASVEGGTRREAIWFSFSANCNHGFARQPGTVKEVLIEKIFPDSEWGKLTDAEIGKWVGATERYIRKVRNEHKN